MFMSSFLGALPKEGLAPLAGSAGPADLHVGGAHGGAQPPSLAVSSRCVPGRSRVAMAAFSYLGVQIAQNRSYLYTLGPKVSIIYILGA